MNFKLRIVFYLVQFKWNRFLYKLNPGIVVALHFRQFVQNLKRSPFYKPHIKSSRRISDFPIINKKIFIDHFDLINTKGVRLEEAFAIASKAELTRDFSPMINGISVGLSSGTSGNRGIFLASQSERARWVACILDRVIGFSFKKRKVAFFLRANNNLYSSVQSAILQFHFFDLLSPMAQNLSKLAVCHPDILIAQPSMLLEIAKAMEKRELAIRPRKIISVAEVLTPEDSAYLTSVFKQTIHQVYQCTEGFLAHSCKNGTLHFNEDFLLIEKKYIDGEKHRFHPIVTDLMRTVQPVVRYELDDIIIQKTNCKCGSRMLAIESIEGRSDDILVFESLEGKQIKIFPDFFRRVIITSSDKIHDYTLTQKTTKCLELFVGLVDPSISDGTIDAINAFLVKNGVHGVVINIKNEKDHCIGQKLRRIKNDMHQTN